MKTRAIGIMLALCALACQPDRQNPAGSSSEVRDSAGVRIVDNVRPPEGSRLGWTIGPEPTVSIGVLEGEEPYMLNRVSDATRLSDGRIVVVNSGTSEMRVFDPSGAYVATWAGRGEGPGEFRDLLYAKPWPGDSIAAWFGYRRGISLFDSDGNFGRNIILQIDPRDPNTRFTQPAAVTAGGLILSGQHPHILHPVQVEIRDAEGRLLSSLGEHPGDERYIENEGTDQARMYQPIFGATVAQVPWGDLVVHSLNNRYEIRAFAADGPLARIVRWGDAPPAPTPEEVEAYIEERVSWYPVHLTPSEIEEYQAETRREYQSLPVVEHMPAFASVIVDRLNHLWVEEYELPGDERPGSVWTVFDDEGRLLGNVELPEDGLWIYEIGEDYVLFVTRDELDVEYVQLWPLERS